MKYFMDLVIKGSIENLDKFRETIGDFISGDWKKSDNSRFTNDYIVFEYHGNEVERASVFIYIKDKLEYKVGNIVPVDKNRLTYDEYNLILKKCADECIIPCAEKCGLSCRLSSDEVDLEDFMSASSATKLRIFSSAANKSTGSSHLLDRERWNDFICETFICKDKNVLSILGKWLSEEDGWDDEYTSELVCEYENGISLLEHFTRYYRG